MSNSAITRTGRFWLFVDGIEVPSNTNATVRAWVALPPDYSGQEVRLGRFQPEPTEIITEASVGNRVAYWELQLHPAESQIRVTYDLIVKSWEVISKPDTEHVKAWDRDSNEYRRFTQSEPWIELRPEILSAAKEIAGNETNPLLQAKRIFDWVLKQMKYEYPDMKHRGAEISFFSRKGDCGEFSVVFAALCRSLGIPARTVTCVWYQGSGHQWAEILIPPYGWIPVDTSIAQIFRPGNSTLPEDEKPGFLNMIGLKSVAPEYFFGNLYPNRLIVSVGNNLEFKAAASGGSRLFRFIQPGAASADPPGIEFTGLKSNPAHAAFYLFGDNAENEAVALTRAQKEMASMHLNAGRTVEAETGLRLIIRDNPANAEAWLNLGQIMLGKNELDSAVAAFEKCLEGKSGSVTPVIHVWARNLMGNCLDLQGKRSEAIEQYERVITSGIDYSDSLEYARKYWESPYTNIQN